MLEEKLLHFIATFPSREIKLTIAEAWIHVTAMAQFEAAGEQAGDIIAGLNKTNTPDLETAHIKEKDASSGFRIQANLGVTCWP